MLFRIYKNFLNITEQNEKKVEDYDSDANEFENNFDYDNESSTKDEIIELIVHISIVLVLWYLGIPVSIGNDDSDLDKDIFDDSDTNEDIEKPEKVSRRLKIERKKLENKELSERRPSKYCNRLPTIYEEDRTIDDLLDEADNSSFD